MVLSAERLEGVCERLYGERTYVTHRARLLDAVKAAVPKDWVRLGARCTEVALDRHRARLGFADGRRLVCYVSRRRYEPGCLRALQIGACRL